LANNSSRFIPHFATLTESLRKLTSKGVSFNFGLEQKASFQLLKESMAEADTLAYFDKSASTKVIADATPVGLGAELMQNQNGAWVPICYASSSLTECERAELMQNQNGAWVLICYGSRRSFCCSFLGIKPKMSLSVNMLP